MRTMSAGLLRVNLTMSIGNRQQGIYTDSKFQNDCLVILLNKTLGRTIGQCRWERSDQILNSFLSRPVFPLLYNVSPSIVLPRCAQYLFLSCLRNLARHACSWSYKWSKYFSHFKCLPTDCYAILLYQCTLPPISMYSFFLI